MTVQRCRRPYGLLEVLRMLYWLYVKQWRRGEASCISWGVQFLRMSLCTVPIASSSGISKVSIVFCTHELIDISALITEYGISCSDVSAVVPASSETRSVGNILSLGSLYENSCVWTVPSARQTSCYSTCGSTYRDLWKYPRRARCPCPSR